MLEDSAKRHNKRIFPIYKMFAWDLLFYYSIIFLFLTQAKGLTASQVLFADSFYPLFKLFTQISCTSFASKLGKTKSVLIGNILVSASILVVILGKGIGIVIFSNFICAIGYNLKFICESGILSDSLPDSPKKSDIFSKIDGKGGAGYYILEAVSAFSTGFLFVANPYLPMILCFIFCLIATLLSLGFQATPDDIPVKTEKVKFSKKIRSFKHVSLFILKSKRLRGLLLYSGVFTGTLIIFKTLMNSLLVDLKVPEQFFGLIFMFVGIAASVASKNQQFFQNRFKNRTLTFLCLPLILSILMTGLVVICDISYTLSLVSTFIMVAIYAIVKGPFYTLIKRYLNSFASSDLSTKIYSANAIINDIFQSALSLFASYLLSITSTAYSLTILGGLLLVVYLLLLDYMKTRVGLKPEEYNKSDIEFVELK